MTRMKVMDVHVKRLEHELKADAVSVDAASDSNDLVCTETRFDLFEYFLENVLAATINTNALNNTIESLDGDPAIIDHISERSPNAVE